MTLGKYTNQQARCDLAFPCRASYTTAECEACGRTYFVTSPGHGDYRPGELARLRQLAAEQPDRYIEVPDISNVSMIDMGSMSVNPNHTVVVGCICDPTKILSDFIELWAEELTEYLRLYWKEKRDTAVGEAELARQSLLALAPQEDGRGDWLPMDSAPKDATWVDVLCDDGVTMRRAIWISVPKPSEGWFYYDASEFVMLKSKPISWRPIIG